MSLFAFLLTKQTTSPTGETVTVNVTSFTLNLRGRVLVKREDRFMPVSSSEARFSDYVTKVQINVDQLPPTTWIREPGQQADGVSITREVASALPTTVGSLTQHVCACVCVCVCM
jgi:hypothetical protein